ncbi:co-chaperone DjlA [Lentisalinibacter sediminis]|uniref:co-chaperone DjlA n=1 Tax=Lentisalinibacter sediminis TaxID=2992237 RepID=UPI003866FA41
MNWWGKLAGGLLGLATGRPLFAVLGVLLGHQFDRGYAKWRESRAGPTRLPAEFLRITFETMGHLAKADGRVSEAEIGAARRIMHELGLSADDTRSAIEWFNQGKRADYPLRGRLQRLAALAGRGGDLGRAFLRLQLRIALADGRMHERERALLWAMAGEFGIGRVEFAQMEAVLRAQRGFARSERGRAERKLVDHAYEVLGVPESASDTDIKQAYRRLMNRYHPDKLASKDLSPEDLAGAQQRTREIRNAYESLKARRGFR